MTSEEHETAGPSRVLGSSGPAWLVFVLGGLTAVALAVGLWAVLAPESLARTYGKWRNAPLEIESLAVTVDRQMVNLPPNGTMEIHPGQRFAIAGLASNRWHNYDLRLHSKDFDINAVTGGASVTPRELLGGESFERPRELRIEVWDKGVPVAVFTILTRFTYLDFSARGDVADSPDEKVDNYQKALDLDPGSEPIRDKLVAALTAAGRKQRAAEILEEEMVRSGPREEHLKRLFDLYGDLAQTPRQIETLGLMIKLAESRNQPAEPFKIQLARLYQSSGRPAEAAGIYEDLIRNAPTEKAAAYLGELVAVYRDSRDSEREIDALKRLAAIVPPDQASSLWLEITEIYKKSGDESGSLAAWQALADSLPDGESKVNALKMIGTLLARAQKYPEALSAYRAALKMTPGDTNIILNLARLSAANGDRTAYRNYLGQALDQDGDLFDVRLELAEALVQDKQNEPAKRQYREILKRKPADMATRVALMNLLEKTGDKKGLIEQYSQLVELNPDDKVIVYNLGALLFDSQEFVRAVEAFKKVIKLDPKDLEAREYLVAAFQRNKQNKEMLAEALELYKLAPSKTVYRTLLLNTYENAKDWGSFAKVAEEITKVEPNEAFGWQESARAQTALNKKEEAADSLRKAAERTEKNGAAAWLKAGEAFASLGKKNQAREAYEKVLELDPGNKAAGRAISELEPKKEQKNN